MQHARPRSARPEPCRRDGWTAARQLAFLDTLVRTRSASEAARAAGMSRESAYRLRGRRDGALFAAIWDMAIAPPPLAQAVRPGGPQDHISAVGDGLLARLLGTQFRRERADFAAIGSPPGKGARGNRTGTS